MNADLRLEELQASVKRFANARGIRSIRDCSANNRSDRRVYRLGTKFIAKLFAPEARDCYERERTFLELDIGPGRCPNLVESTFDADTGGYLVMTALAGRRLADVHQDLTAADFSDIAGDLGACLAAIHVVPLTKVHHLPQSALEAERRRQFNSIDEVVDRLKREQILPEGAILLVLEAVRKGREVAFQSPRRLTHGDVHNANVFISRRGGRWSCALIDFEASAPDYVELDFVHPFLSTLGEAFPGRRLAASWQHIWQSFAGGYASIAETEPDLELIVGHALAWYLWVAAHSLDKSHPKWRDFAGIALDGYAVLKDASAAGMRPMGPRGRTTV